jgi:ComF family protein
MTIISSLRHLGQGLLHLVYPNACWVCQAALAPEKDPLCPACEATLTADPHATCPRCASTVGPYTASVTGCIHCRHDKFHFDRAVRLGPYEGRLREVILRMKYRKEENLAELMGNLWARSLPDRLGSMPDMIVPIPLHWTRAWSRGFNQSEILARALARRLKLFCQARVLYRCRRTPQQAGQTLPSARHDNVRGAFALRGKRDWTGKTILLVDDVLTTGATASAAALALRAFKPAQIIVAVLAHDRSR